VTVEDALEGPGLDRAFPPRSRRSRRLQVEESPSPPSQPRCASPTGGSSTTCVLALRNLTGPALRGRSREVRGSGGPPSRRPRVPGKRRRLRGTRPAWSFDSPVARDGAAGRVLFVLADRRDEMKDAVSPAANDDRNREGDQPWRGDRPRRRPEGPRRRSSTSRRVHLRGDAGGPLRDGRGGSTWDGLLRLSPTFRVRQADRRGGRRIEEGAPSRASPASRAGGPPKPARAPASSASSTRAARIRSPGGRGPGHGSSSSPTARSPSRVARNPTEVASVRGPMERPCARSASSSSPSDSARPRSIGPPRRRAARGGLPASIP